MSRSVEAQLDEEVLHNGCLASLERLKQSSPNSPPSPEHVECTSGTTELVECWSKDCGKVYVIRVNQSSQLTEKIRVVYYS